MEDANGRRKSIVISPEDIRKISGKGANNSDWLEKYLYDMEEIDEGLPEPRGCPLSTTVYLDYNHEMFR